MTATNLRPAVFLDRDGTLMEDVDYCNDPATVRVFPGTREALLDLKRAGFTNVIITNQSGIGRGRITPAQYEAVQDELLRQLGPGVIDATYHCPGAPEENPPCRKPKPFMVLQAAKDLHLDLARSIFIGDKPIDIECGHNAGTRAILVKTGYGGSAPACRADFIARDVSAAVKEILKPAG